MSNNNRTGQLPRPNSPLVTGVGIGVLLLGLVGLFLSGQYLPDQSGGRGIAALPSASLLPVSFPPVSDATRTSCRVLFVYDGDTIACDLNGDGRIEKPEEQIRLLGVDTPEMHYSRKNRTHGQANERDEPFAKEASQFTTERLTNKTVYLAFDLNHHDKYGRTLAYVYQTPTDHVSFCEELLRKGYARTLFIPPNMQLYNRFKTAQRQARQEKIGLWQADI